MKESIIITKESAESASGGRGERLDKFLAENRPEKSRSQWQKAVKTGLILVNDKKVSVHYSLRTGDRIFVGAETPNQKIIKDLDLKIIYEDNDFLVIDKPANLTVHPANENYPEETLIDLLLKKYPELRNVGEDKSRPGIVHRLDKDVSGLMVIARNNNSLALLKNQFQNREVKKEYLALVGGQMPRAAGVIDFPIDRTANGNKMAARPKSQGGKEAITEYEVMEKIKNYSLLKIKIKTGRTHQIRVHLNAIGHPVVGDNVYSPSKMKVKSANRRNRPIVFARRLFKLQKSGQRLAGIPVGFAQGLDKYIGKNQGLTIFLI